MALTAPTSFAVRQRYALTDDTFVAGNISDPLRRGDIRIPGYGGIPTTEARLLELSWTENEAGECNYEVLYNRGLGDQATVAVIRKGVARAQFQVAARSRAAADHRLPDWGSAFSGNFSVRAKSASDASAWVDLSSVTDTLGQITPATLPLTTSSAAAGLTLSWSPDAVGVYGTLIFLYPLEGGYLATNYPALVIFARAPRTSVLIPHTVRPLIDDSVAMVPYPDRGIGAGSDRVLRFVNGAGYRITAQAIHFSQGLTTSRRIKYGYPVWTPGPVSQTSVVWADAGTGMAIFPATLAPIVGVPLRYTLQSTVAVTWSITAGEEPWIILDPASGTVTITAPDLQKKSVTLQATDGVTTLTTKITINPKPKPAPPVVKLSQTVLNNGFSYKVGEEISIRPTAAGATEWQLQGPPGVKINASTGQTYGSVLAIGRYSLSWQARRENSEWSDPLVVPLKITKPESDFNLSLARFEWLSSEWTLTDLQMDLVQRTVSSSRLLDRAAVPAAGAPASAAKPAQSIALTTARKRLVFKPGDDIKFAVFLLLGNEPQTVSGLSKIRISMRPEGNQGEPFFFETSASPTVNTSQGDPYYAITGKLTEVAGDALSTALSRAKTKNVPLVCVADIEITVDGSVYSSQTFEAEIEQDVTRDD